MIFCIMFCDDDVKVRNSEFLTTKLPLTIGELMWIVGCGQCCHRGVAQMDNSIWLGLEFIGWNQNQSPGVLLVARHLCPATQRWATVGLQWIPFWSFMIIYDLLWSVMIFLTLPFTCRLSKLSTRYHALQRFAEVWSKYLCLDPQCRLAFDLHFASKKHQKILKSPSIASLAGDSKVSSQPTQWPSTGGWATVNPVRSWRHRHGKIGVHWSETQLWCFKDL